MRKIKLFDYQEDMKRRIGEAFRVHRSVMVQMPTGTGKTHLLAAIVKDFAEQNAKPVVWIVAHRRELVAQINDTLERFGIPPTNAGVKALSIQWLSRHCDEMGEEPGLIVIDEAHHALAETYKVLWEKFPKTKFLGLTATPCRLNRKGFSDLFDTLVSSYSVGKFIQMGYLAPFDYVSIRPDSEEQKLVDSLVKRGADGDFQAKEMAEVLNTKPSIERLYRSFSDFAKDKKGIVYAINIDHARKIAEYYSAHGVGAVAIDSKTPSSLRKELIERFKLPVETLGRSSCIKGFPTTPSLLHKEGSTSLPKPLAPQERGDVAGYAIASPEFWYRQRSLCPQGAADDFLTQQSCDCLCGVNRLASSTSDVSLEKPLNSSLFTLRSSLNSPIQVLVNVDIFSEGFDCPDVEFIQLARPTLSLAKYLQMVGRGLRVTKEKKACVIIDNVGLYRMFGLPTMPWNWQSMFRGRFYRKRITGYRQMLLRGNDWERLVPLSGHDCGDDPEIMVLMKHEQLMDYGKEEAMDGSSRPKRKETTEADYQIVEKKGEYGVFKEGDGSKGYGILRLEDKQVILPPICWRGIQFFSDRTVRARKIDDSNDLLIDLISGRRFESFFFCDLSAHVYSYGNISLLRVRNEFYTRTQKSYVTVFPISKDDISYHNFYLLIHDPMAKRKMPVCVIEGDETQYYWLVEKLADQSIYVMTDEEVYYHVMPNGKKKRIRNAQEVKSEERRAKKVKSEERRVEKANAVSSRRVEPVKMGAKWGMKVDGKLFVAPIYRSILPLNEEFFAIEKLPGLWGIMNLAGNVVVEPQYTKVELKDEHSAVLHKVNGVQEIKGLG